MGPFGGSFLLFGSKFIKMCLPLHSLFFATKCVAMPDGKLPHKASFSSFLSLAQLVVQKSIVENFNPPYHP